MAMPDTAALAPLSPGGVAGLPLLWPKPSPGLALSVVEPMHVLSLRHLPDGGAAALKGALAAQGLPIAVEPGRCTGSNARLIWRSPHETLLLTPDPAQAAALLGALRPGPGLLACAIDLSQGSLVVAIQGSRMGALLSRLVDAQAVPREVGHASRMRLVDIAAVVWREAPDRVGVLVDRANDQYLARWLSHAADAV